jgi:hypothetical protein
MPKTIALEPSLLPTPSPMAHYLCEFSLLALFPRRDLEDAPPFVQLGTQFLLEHEAFVHLDCSSVTGGGRLVLP